MGSRPAFFAFLTVSQFVDKSTVPCYNLFIRFRGTSLTAWFAPTSSPFQRRGCTLNTRLVSVSTKRVFSFKDCMSVKQMGLVYDLALPRSQKSVLLALADHADHDGMNAYPGVPLLAYKTGFSERQVQRSLSSLLERGLITADKHAEGGRGLVTVYTLHLEKGDKMTPFIKGDKVTPNQKGDNLARLQKGDISDSERVTFTTEKGDIYDTPSPYMNRPDPSEEPSVAVPAKKQVDSAKTHAEKSKRFVKPTYEEAEAYAAEIGIPGEGVPFVDCQDAKGWIYGYGRVPIKDWKAALRTWRNNKKRFGEGGGGPGSVRPASINIGPILQEIEAAFASKSYYRDLKYNPDRNRTEIAKQKLPDWSDPIIGKAIDSLGGFFQLRERVSQASAPGWKQQIERYYRQEKEAQAGQ